MPTRWYFAVTITNVNAPPVLATIAPQTVNENAQLSFTATATDPDGDPVSYSVTGNPEGSAIDAGTGVFTWTPDFNANDRVANGNYGGTDVSVSDGNGGTDNQVVLIHVNNVNQLPVVDAIADQTVNEGDLLTFTATATDADTLSSIAGWAVSGNVAGASIDNAGVYSFTPSPTQGGNVFTETLTATDDRGGTGNTSFQITVNDVNHAPAVAAIADQTVGENALLTVTPSGSDPDGDVLTWSGSSLPSGSAVDANTGVFTWTPAFGDAGNYAGVTLTATDPGTLSASASFAITVTHTNRAPVVDAIANQTVAEGALLTVNPSASDADGDAISWGGSNLPSGAAVDGTSGAFTWTPDFSQAGNYSAVTLTASDGTDTGSASFDITVTDTGRAPVVDPIANQTVAENDLLAFTATATDPDGDAFTWSGVNFPSGAAIDANSGAFTWTPGFDQAGTYSNVQVVATDAGLAAGSTSFGITVTNVNRAPSIASIADQTTGEGVLLTVTPSASDPDGDVLAYSGSALPSGASVNASTGVLSWTPSFADAGNYAGVTITADDNNGGTASASFAITVTNVNQPPTIASIANQSGMEMVLLTVTPSASDPDGDVLAWSGANLPSGATVDASTGVFTWTPTSSQSGSYTNVTLTADDGNGGSVSANFDITVADQAPVVSTTMVHFCTGATSTQPLAASDDDGHAITWSMTGNPVWLSIDASTGVLTGSPASGDLGFNGNVAVTVTDAVSTAAATYDVTVAVDCVPARTLNAIASTAAFNRHRAAGSSYTVRFAVEGDVRAEEIAASQVSLDNGTTRLTATTVAVENGAVVATFDGATLVTLVGDAASGETVSLTLNVAVHGDVMSAPYGVVVTGLNAAAAVQVVQNPVSGPARVQYVVPEDGAVRVVVFDARGRQVAALVDQVTPAGRYEVVWNGRGVAGSPVPSGVYYLRATLGGEQAGSRMLVVR